MHKLEFCKVGGEEKRGEEGQGRQQRYPRSNNLRGGWRKTNLRAKELTLLFLHLGWYFELSPSLRSIFKNKIQSFIFKLSIIVNLRGNFVCVHDFTWIDNKIRFCFPHALENESCYNCVKSETIYRWIEKSRVVIAIKALRDSIGYDFFLQLRRFGGLIKIRSGILVVSVIRN